MEVFFMRKIICLCISFLILFSFAGCSKKTEPVAMKGLYSINADVKLGDFEATVGLNRLGNGVWDINFTKPDNINGLGVSYQNENMKITYKGLAFSIPRDDIPIKSIVTNLTSILDNVSLGKNVDFRKDGDKVIAKGKTDSGSYKVTFDEKTGSLVSMELEDIDLTANFSGYKPMG